MQLKWKHLRLFTDLRRLYNIYVFREIQFFFLYDVIMKFTWKLKIHVPYFYYKSLAWSMEKITWYIYINETAAVSCTYVALILLFVVCSCTEMFAYSYNSLNILIEVFFLEIMFLSMCIKTWYNIQWCISVWYQWLY